MNSIKSSLTNSELISLIKENWNITVDHIEKLPRATAICAKVYSNGEKYFLKEFQDSYTTMRAIREADVGKKLIDNNIPVSEIMPTVLGKPYELRNNTVFQLQKYVNGRTPIPNTLQENTLCYAAEYLGKIHSVLQNYDLPHLYATDWIKKFNATEYISFYEETLDLLEGKNFNEAYKKKIQEDLKFRIDLTKHMESISRCYEKITYTSSHGDFIPSQLICNDEKITAIVDFANVHTVPAVLELMRFYWMGSTDCANPNDFNIDLFKKYLTSYLKYFELSKDDLKNMPYIYLYYMGRNRFLYRQYLSTGDETVFYEASNKADVSHYLFMNADKISTQLLHL